jgi:hypothetical protein
MKLLIVMATLLSQDPPADAPRDMVTKAGDIVPFNGYCVEEKEFIKREQKNAKNAFIVEEAQKQVLLSPVVVVAIVLGAVATGVALTVGSIEIKRVIDKKD